MGLTFAKSVKLGAVRFNFSGSGIGVSVGIPGLRIGTGPRGAYIAGGMGGFRYRKSLSSSPATADQTQTGRPSARGDLPAPSIPTESSNVSHTVLHNTKNVLELRDSSEDDLLRSINEQRNKMQLWPSAAGSLLLALYLAKSANAPWPDWAIIALMISGASLTGWLAWRDRMRKLTVLFFEPDDQTKRFFEALHAATKTAANALKLVSVAQTAKYRDTKYTGGASKGLSFSDASFSVGQAPGISANVDVPLVKAGKTLLAFFPDRALVFQGKSVGAIEYKSLNVESTPTQFIESESVPSDAQVVGKTWQYVNKNGGPDRRFKNNREYPICRYNELNMTTADGFDVRFMASRPDAFDHFAVALKRAAELCNQPKKKAPSSEPGELPRQVTPLPSNAGTVRPPASGEPQRSPARIEEPVIVTPERTAQVHEFKVPAPPRELTSGKWIPSGGSALVGDVTIPGGMVYVGTSLSTPQGGNDPCLIDPSKSVARQGDYTEREMGYWPSYSEISPSSRRAYLNWLAGGRKDPEADVGYVFLFFYGLERRAIIDGAKDEAAQADWPVIAAELRRLLAIYGEKSHSFRRYASELLDWVSLASHPSKLYEKPVPALTKTMELPIYIRLALGQAAVDGVPVPAHLALAWAKLEPNTYLRTPATRCPAQFEQLFAQKYADLFGSGMVLPRNRTKLKLVYRPASAGFRGYEEIKLTFKDTPDVTVLTAPIKKLQEVVEAATKPLESFSRMVGKNPDATTTLEALLQLPAPLWPEGAQKALQALKERMDEGMVVLPFQDLLGALGAKKVFTKDKTASLIRTLESANVGFEPDVLNGAKAPKPEEHVVLFALPPSEQLPRANGPYLAAALTLQLASAVASADGEFGIHEMGHLRKTVLSWQHLTPGQTRRLLAHLRLLMQAPASLTVLKKKFEPLDLPVKETIASFMATVAQSDGEVSPTEVKMLEKVYKALGVDPKRVFSDLHAVAAGTKPTAAAVAKVEGSGFKLDPARIAALQRDTEKVSALLANIFTEPDEPAAAAMPESAEVEPAIEGAESAETAEASSGLMGLDAAHTALARMMLSRPEWSREELLDVAADLDLMLDGALEHINEAAFDAHDMALFEGDDPVTVNTEIMNKVEA